MDRNNTDQMKKLMQLISLVLIIPILQGCLGQQPTKNTIIGVWISVDKGIFSFKDDGSFTSENLPGSKIFSGFANYEGMNFSESGNWELKEASGGLIVSLNFRKSEKLQGGFSTQLIVSGEGLLENKPPWRLFVWIGDPDDMNRYEFRKQ